MEHPEEMPSVLAFDLAKAQKILKGSGWTCLETVVTAAPGRTHPPADVCAMLVVRQQYAGDKSVRLTVSYHPGLAEAREDPPGET